MTTPTDINVPTAPAVAPPAQTDEVVAVAEKLVRTKSFLKTTFSRVGVPVLIGAAAAYVATRNRGDEDTDTVDGEIIDTTEA